MEKKYVKEGTPKVVVTETEEGCVFCDINDTIPILCELCWNECERCNDCPRPFVPMMDD